MNLIPAINRWTVLKLALVSEALIVTVGLAICWLFSTSVPFSFSFSAAAFGAIAAVPMLIFNILVFSYLSHDSARAPIYHRFKNDVVMPLCGDHTLLTAAILALCSGFAEEFLFRGALLIQLSVWLPTVAACVIVSFFFSYVHFIGSLRLYWQLVLFYFLFGLYFCWIFIFSGDLLAPIVTHTLYNFLIILYLRRLYTKPRENSPLTLN